MTGELEIPENLSEWTKGGITEALGTQKEHTDEFYRHGNLGAELHSDGIWAAYAIVDGHPIMVRDKLMSFAEVVEFFKGSFCSKRLSDGEDEEKDDVPDVDEEPEFPSDGEMGITIMLKSITEMMSPDYDGVCAVRKGKNTPYDWKALDRKARKTESGNELMDRNANKSKGAGRSQTWRGLTDFANMRALYPKASNLMKNYHKKFTMDAPSHTVDPKSRFGGGKKYGWKDVLDPSKKRSLEEVEGLPGAYRFNTYDPDYVSREKIADPTPVFTDNLSLNQMNDLLLRSFKKIYGDYDEQYRDLPFIKGFNLDYGGDALARPYINSASDSPGELGAPINLDGRFFVNPNALLYGTKRSTENKRIPYWQRLFRNPIRAMQNTQDKLFTGLEYKTKEDALEALRALDPESKTYHNDMNDILMGTPYGMAIDILKEGQYKPTYKNVKSGKLGYQDSEGNSDIKGLVDAILNSKDIRMRRMKAYIDNPENDPNAPIPDWILRGYRRGLGDILSRASPDQIYAFYDSGHSLMDPRYITSADIPDKPVSEKKIGTDITGNVPRPTSERLAELIGEYNPLDPENTFSTRHDEFVKEYGAGQLPVDYLPRQIEAVDRFHENFRNTNQRKFDPDIDITNPALRDYYRSVIGGVEQYRDILGNIRDSEDDLRENYNALKAERGEEPDEDEFTSILEAYHKPTQDSVRYWIGNSGKGLVTGEDEYELEDPSALYFENYVRRERDDGDERINLAEQPVLGHNFRNTPTILRGMREGYLPVALGDEEGYLKNKVTDDHQRLKRALHRLNVRSHNTSTPLPKSIIDAFSNIAYTPDEKISDEDVKKNLRMLEEFKSGPDRYAFNDYEMLAHGINKEATREELERIRSNVNRYYNALFKRKMSDEDRGINEKQRDTLFNMIEHHLTGAPIPKGEFTESKLKTKSSTGNGRDKKEPGARPKDIEEIQAAIDAAQAQDIPKGEISQDKVKEGADIPDFKPAEDKKDDERTENPLMKSITDMISEKHGACYTTPPEEYEMEILNENPRSIVIGAGKMAIPDPQHMVEQDIYRTYSIKDFPKNFPGKD